MEAVLKGLAFAVFAFFGIILLLGTFSPPTQSTVTPTPRDPSRVRHCFSAWNGSHPDLVRTVRAALHDPRSFEHVRTILAGQDGSPQRSVVMTYRARNPLGATVTSRASATIYPPACALSIVSLEH